MDTPPYAIHEDAIAALIAKSKRHDAVPLRKTFLQQKSRGRLSPGPLHQFVRRHDERALDLYLLVHLIAVSEPHKVLIEAGGWARALDLPSASGATTISRIWKRLADLKLIARDRESRMAAITLLREDGSGKAYTRPSGETHSEERYLKLPLAYWTNRWYETITLPAKALLLIALSLPDDFYLPTERVPEWYGISADTALRGFAELRNVELLQHEDRYKKAPLTTQGWAVDRRYTLQTPFRPKRREPSGTPPEGGTGADIRDSDHK